MNYENKQQEEKEFKNKTGNKQISDNRDLKSNRGRKRRNPYKGLF